MNSRRSFLKGILATAAIVATGKIACVAEDVLGFASKPVLPALEGIEMMLVEESGRIGEMISSKLLSQSPWTCFVKVQPWPSNPGDSLLPSTPSQVS